MRNFAIYRIYCSTNEKSYVGLASDYEGRTNQHKSALRSDRHENLHLQYAWNKYGEDAFEFSVLKDSIKGLNAAKDYEIQYIEQLDSYDNGFNQTQGGDFRDANCTPCVWNGIEYPSIREAALANNLSSGQMSYRLKQGYSCDSDLKKIDKRLVTWNGNIYPSLNEAARQLGIAVSTLQYRINEGYTCDAELPQMPDRERLKTPIVWNGLKYWSIQIAAEHNKITSDALRGRLKAGYTCDADMKRSKP